MRRILLAAALLLFPMLARAQTDEQALVDRSTLAVQEMMTQRISQTPRMMLSRSRAVLVCPRIFKAGFFLAGSGGSCVLLARAGNGTWSYPAFFILGSASFGLQIGLQDSALILMVLTNRGLDALLSSHFKLGGDASLAIATIGGGVQGALTTGLTADIVAFQSSRGAFAGISLEGSVMSADLSANQVYYGRRFDTRQIVIDMQGANPGADPLRGVLTRLGVPPVAAPYPQAGHPPQPGYVQGSTGYAPTYPPSATGYTPMTGYQGPPESRGVQQQNLLPSR